MNSVVLTSYCPDKPWSGSALRNWQNIQALMLLGTVDVVSVGVEDRTERRHGLGEWASFSNSQRSAWDRTKTACWLLRPRVYPSIDEFHSHSVTRWLKERAKKRRYDVAVIETISLASYFPDVRPLADRVVFDAHNAEAALHLAALGARIETDVSAVRRAKDWVLHRRMAAAEGRVVSAADVVWVCSDHDAREMERAYHRRNGIAVVPNGIDVDAYRREKALPPAADWSRWPITLVYPGIFTYSPNEAAALRLIREVLPAVRARGYPARVVLVGRDPTPTLLAAAEQDGEVEVTGTVESILPYLEQPCVVTLPIAIGSGTRLKILEAFAVGRPVVSTPKAAEGIDAIDGEHIVIREEPDAMAGAVIDLWHSPQMRAGLCARALELVRARYSWSVAAERIACSLGFESGGYSRHAGLAAVAGAAR